MSEWIEYLNDRSVVLPTEGYVEYMTTWDDNDTGCLEASRIQGDILWNRASPMCVKKYRIVDKEYYVKWKKNSLSLQINETLNKLTDQMNEFRDLEKCE